MRAQCRVVAVCLLLLLAVSGCQRDPDAENPLAAHLPVSAGHDVVIVSFDALRADTLGAYGYARDTSPNIDRFAADSLVFENAVVAGKDTPSSFAGAFTAELPFRVFRGWELQPVPTLATSFSDAGYFTAGLMHNVQLVSERGFHRGFDHYETIHSGRASDEEVVQMASEWLARRPEGRFLLWVHFIAPHAPYRYREFATAFYDPGYDGPYEEAGPGRLSSLEPPDAADRRRLRDLYDGEVLHADRLFGALVTELKRHDAWNNSVVVLTSDHGDAFGEHGVWGHGTLYDEVLRVPLIVRHPVAEKGGRTDMPVSNLDLYPTLADALEVPRPTHMDGISLVGSHWRERPLVSVAMTRRDYRAFAVRAGSEKLIARCTPEHELGDPEYYDLESDPGETRNPAGSDRDSLSTLLGHLHDLAGERPCATLHDAMQGKSIEHGMDEDRIEQLRSLGYIQ